MTQYAKKILFNITQTDLNRMTEMRGSLMNVRVKRWSLKRQQRDLTPVLR